MIEGSKLGYYLMPILRVWLFLFFLLACIVPFGMILQFDFLPSIDLPVATDIIVYICLVLVVLGGLLMMFRLFPYLNFHGVFIRRSRFASGFLKGAGLGVLVMAACAMVLHLCGNVNFEKGELQWQLLGLYLIYFLLVSVFEEFLFRSYLLLAFAERYPLGFAVVVNGMLFALAHFANPGVTALGIFNIALAGVLFSIYTLQRQNIAWAIGLHFAWNFTQTIVLGYNASGNKMNGMIKAVPIGKEYLSGGSFGIEGSVCCTILLIIWIVWLYYKGGFGFVEVNDPQVEAEEERLT